MHDSFYFFFFSLLHSHFHLFNEMYFSLYTVAIAAFIAILCIQETIAAPTKQMRRAGGLQKRQGGYYVLSQPPPAQAAPVCPDPKDPRCPVAGGAPSAPPPTAAPAAPAGIPIPGPAIAPLPDLGLVTAGLSAPPATPDPLGIVSDLVTSQTTAATGIVPGLMGGLGGLGGGGQDD